jgi:hypothetical protein
MVDGEHQLVDVEAVPGREPWLTTLVDCLGQVGDTAGEVHLLRALVRVALTLGEEREAARKELAHVAALDVHEAAQGDG